MTNESKIIQHLREHGSITIREMASYPYYINSAYPIIKRIKEKLPIAIQKGWNKRTRKHYNIYYLNE